MLGEEMQDCVQQELCPGRRERIRQRRIFCDGVGSRAEVGGRCQSDLQVIIAPFLSRACEENVWLGARKGNPRAKGTSGSSGGRRHTDTHTHTLVVFSTFARPNRRLIEKETEEMIVE